MNTTPYPRNTAYMAHPSHVARQRKDDRCRLCEDHGLVKVSWRKFTALYPEWATR